MFHTSATDTCPNPIYRHLLLPPVRLLTRRDAEVAMNLHLAFTKRLQQIPGAVAALSRLHHAPNDPALAQDLLDGLHFPHPFGIAAGLDKNAAAYPAMVAHFSAAFIEVGTVTLRPQAGNSRPRIIRHDKNHLGNRMGFPNAGAAVVAENLRTSPVPKVPLGINIGKLKDTPEAGAAEHGELIRHFAGYPQSFYVIDVSSPNTPGLRDLQSIAALTDIVHACMAAIDEQRELAPRPRRRVLIKLAPDLAFEDVAAVIELIQQTDAGGLVLTNTLPYKGFGGMSGPDLYTLSSKMVKFAAGLLPADRVIIATGGINTVDRAYEMLQYADLVGSYTSLVLQGPGMLRHLARGVSHRLHLDGLSNVAQLREGNRPAVRHRPAAN